MYLIRVEDASSRKARELYRVQAPAWAMDSELLFLEMRGPEQACRAIWAYLVQHRRERSIQTLSTVWIQEGMEKTHLRINPLARYHMVSLPTGLVMLHEEFNRLNGKLVLGGDKETPSPWFGDALQRNVAVPFLPDWIPSIWRKAVSGKLVARPRETHGPIPVWRIKFSSGWEKLISDLVREGQWLD